MSENSGPNIEMKYEYLVFIIVLFSLSLGGAVILFKFLDSSATIENDEYKIGGAIAGFVVIFSVLFAGLTTLAGRSPTGGFVSRGLAAIGLRSKRVVVTGKENVVKASKKTMGMANKSIHIFGGDLSWIDGHFDILKEKKATNLVDVKVLARELVASGPHIQVAKDLNIKVQTYPRDFIPNITGQIVDDVRILSIYKAAKNPTAKVYNGRVGEDKLFEYRAEIYTKERDPLLFNSMKCLFDSLWMGHGVLTSPSYKRVEIDSIISKLHDVPQYSQSNISSREIRLDRTQPLRKMVDLSRLYDIQKLSAELDDKDNLSFTDSFEILKGTEMKMVVPPILEKRNGNYIVIDGAHRLFTLRASGKSSVNAIVIEGVSAPLPATPQSWDDVTLAMESTTSRIEKYQDFRGEFWRDLSRAGVVN